MEVLSNTNERIQRLRYRYQTDVPKISIDRAKYYTEKWFETENRGNRGLSNVMRVALSMKNVYEKMTHYVDPDDRIAGYWTESFLGIPIDIERGVYNTVLQNELKWGSLLGFRVKSIAKTAVFLVKKRQLGNFRKNMRILKSTGQPMNMKIKTMMQREINRYEIDSKDKKVLLKNLLPRWKGKSLVDILEKEISKSGLIKGNQLDFSAAVPANTSRQTTMLSMCSTIATYQGHVIIDYETVIKKGLTGIKTEIEAKLEKESSLSDSERDFLEALLITIEGTMIFTKRLTEKIESALNSEKDGAKKEIINQMLENCRNVPLNPANSFREAIQSAWTLKTAVELAHPMNLHCLGRMDQMLYPYYKKDIEQGLITREEAIELLAELLLKTMSQNIRPESNILSNFYHRYLGSTPVTIGGLKPDGSDGTNELTYLFLEAADMSRAVTNVSLRVHRNMPEEVLLKVAGTLYNGSSNLSIFNDDVNVEAMKKRGFSDEDSRDYAIMGCVEMLCPGKTGCMSANALLLCRLLDMTLRNGDAQTLIGIVKENGLKSGDPNSFESFDQFIDAVMAQARYQIKLIVDVSNLRDRVFAEYLPAPYISAFMDGCLENKKDITSGGAKYALSGISFINSIANLTDSLHVIKKLVFEEKYITFKQFIEAIDCNYENFEDLHKKIMNIKGKWGNGFQEVDELAREISSKLFKETYKYQNYRVGAFVPYLISMTTHTIDGRISIATPDGRKAATAYAASCNPYNVEENGVTGVFRSVASLDFEHVLGCAVNVKFHPSALGHNEEIRKKWVSLLRTYFDLGGAQIQPTVASAETLIAAQKEPESYRDLIVKVGGYSSYFTELGIEIQNEVIARTQHLS